MGGSLNPPLPWAKVWIKKTLGGRGLKKKSEKVASVLLEQIISRSKKLQIIMNFTTVHPEFWKFIQSRSL